MANQDILISEQLKGLLERLESNDHLIWRGRQLDLRCLIGTPASPLIFTFRHGRIVGTPAAPALMSTWRFAFRASERAWMEYWQPMPRPGWHDLFALFKHGEATVEGDLYPFMTHLQYFKDVLALPRGHVEAAA